MSGAVSAASKSPKKVSGLGGKDSRAGEDKGGNRTDGDGAAQSGRRKTGTESGELQKGGKDAADGDGPGDAGDETEDEEEEQGTAGKGQGEATAGRAKTGAAKGDKRVDIDKLMKEVEERGGYARVEERREWRQIARAIGLPHNVCDSAPVMLRREFIAAGGEGKAKKRGRPSGWYIRTANKAAKSLAEDESEQPAKRAKGKAAADGGDAGGAPGAPAAGLALLAGFAGDMNVNVGSAGCPQGAQDLLQWQQQAFLMHQQQQALGANAGMAVLHQVSLRVFSARS